MPLFLLLAGALALVGVLWTRGVAVDPHGQQVAVPAIGGLHPVGREGDPGPAGPTDPFPVGREALTGVESASPAVSSVDPDTDVEWIDVRVIDRASGAPIPGARVHQYGTDGESETVADEEGQLRLASLGVQIRVGHPDYIDVFAPHLPEARPLCLELTRSLRLSGRLVDESSQGVAEVSVRLGGGPLGAVAGLEQEAPADLLTQSGADGSFEFLGLSPARYSLLIAEADDEYAARLEEGIELWPDDEREFTFVLDGGATLLGQVRWRQANNPIADVHIELAPDWTLWEGREAPVMATRSDEEGRFELAGLARGSYDVHLRSPWGAMVERSVMSPGTGETIELTFELRQPAQVSGRVFDQAGERVRGARVWITTRPEDREFDWSEPTSAGLRSPFLLSAISGADGDYRFDAVPTREALWILALPPGPAAPDERPAYFEPLRLVEGQARTGVDLTLEGTRRLSGIVTDERDQPVAGVRVEAWHARWGKACPGRSATTDADGRFAVGPLPLGPTRVEFSCVGYLDAVQARRLVEGENEVMEQELREAHPITGWVVDESGLGVVGASVRARAVASSGSSGAPRKGEATTDRFGAFHIEGLTERRWKVSAKAPGFTPLAKLGVEVALPDSAPLLLILAAKERTVPGSVHGEVRWSFTGRPVWDLSFEGARGGVTRLSGSSFEVHGIRPGRMRLVARAPGMEPLLFGPVEVVSGASLDLGHHEVARATRATVAVRDAGGALLRKGAEVRLEPLPGAQGGCGERQPNREFAESARAGIFTHDAVPRCRWRLRVTQAGFAPHSEIVRISGPRQTLAVFMRPR